MSRAELLIRGLDGVPLPPPELAAEIERRCPGAGLLYTRAAWAITLRWRPDDARRRFIQTGEMQPEGDFDVVGYLPVNCSLDQAPALIERELKNWPDDAFRDMRAAVDQWNNVGREAAIEDQVMGGVYNDLDHPENAARVQHEQAAQAAQRERDAKGHFKPRPKD